MRFNLFSLMNRELTQSWVKEAMVIQKKAKLSVTKSVDNDLATSVFFQHCQWMDTSRATSTKVLLMQNDSKALFTTTYFLFVQRIQGPDQSLSWIMHPSIVERYLQV